MHRFKSALFAVVHMGGHQYKVMPGDIIQTEKVVCEVGKLINLKKVLLVGSPDFTMVGRPLLEDVQVYASVVDHSQAAMVDVFKKRKKTAHKKWKEHRQTVTHLRIDSITLPNTLPLPDTTICKSIGNTRQPAELQVDAAGQSRFLVEGIPDTIRTFELYRYFARYGNISDCFIPRGQTVSLVQGHAYFTMPEQAVRLILHRRHELGGQRLSVNPAPIQSTPDVATQPTDSLALDPPQDVTNPWTLW
eukprot:NODE_4100_length_840_cov_34.774194_g3942_i0.p1 GENE.NODE_4100_length_840_cov_34.774194_g3942_i0~~NODE_4100_length_840_cov_34.774194_g3942_i0.p1  ORF type:complete len:247 (-),score=49.46 NODE_4100_length_840_cov_34.774194_g3942_i0:47-787(-)